MSRREQGEREVRNYFHRVAQAERRTLSSSSARDYVAAFEDAFVLATLRSFPGKAVATDLGSGQGDKSMILLANSSAEVVSLDLMAQTPISCVSRCLLFAIQIRNP